MKMIHVFFLCLMYLLFSIIYSQVDVSGNRKAVVIHVPYRLRKGFRKIHVRLVRELEKKFSGKVYQVLSFTILYQIFSPGNFSPSFICQLLHCMYSLFGKLVELSVTIALSFPSIMFPPGTGFTKLLGLKSEFFYELSVSVTHLCSC